MKQEHAENSRYSKTLEEIVKNDQRLETGSYYHDSDGHWCSTELSKYSLDGGALGTVHATSVKEFKGILKHIEEVPHDSYGKSSEQLRKETELFEKYLETKDDKIYEEYIKLLNHRPLANKKEEL